MRIAPSGGKAFILRAKVDAHRSDIGLGGYPSVSLAQAKERARRLLEDIRQGIDPIADKKLRKNNVEWTFKRCVEDYLKSHRAGWKSAKHAQQWENTLVTYAFPTMGGKNIKDITVGDVLESIEPNWLTKNETMVRVRSRIELVLAWAATRGYRSKENPAASKGNLDATLLRPSKAHTVKHHESLPYVQMKGFMVRLRQIESVGAKCLEWLILTGTRSNEARGTTWEEIDFAKKSWTIPSERMKGGREHRVTLSPAAILLLRKMTKFEGTTYVFPGSSNEKTLSDMTLTQILRRMKVPAVPHGF